MRAWADPIFKAMAELHGQCSGGQHQLSVQQQADLDKLWSARGTLEILLAGDSNAGQWRHDLRNALGAMRGYAELLGETLSGQQQAIQAALQQLLKAIAAATAEDSITTSIPLRGVTPGAILAVDDTAENLELLSHHLSQAGHQVFTADSGAAALDALHQHSIDTVLLDLIMPGMSGSEVLHRIKTDESLRAIPVIIISGRQDMGGIIACIEAGADDYLLKPFNPVLLQARIKAGLERKRWHDREKLDRRQLERNEKFIRATFGRFVSEEVVANLLEQPEGLELGGDLREVTILMADIRKFTTMCENLEPQQITRLLNTYLGTMSDIIMEHQGTVDEFIGDGILALFGAPIAREDDADRAVLCALHMQAAVEHINREYSTAGLPEISMGIGINTGTVVAGIIGSKKRSKYGIVGHNVNLTSRIEECAPGGEILVSKSTLDKLRDAYRMGRSEAVRVKGIHEEIQLYQIVGLEEAG